MTRLKKRLANRLIQIIPSYQSIFLQFDALNTDHKTVQTQIQSILNDLPSHFPVHTVSNIIRLPVYYDLSVGPDLERIAHYHQIDTDHVIQRHCMNLYHIYAIGFAPGFAYLGHVDDDLATPRLAKPRPHVATGSVGIADHQTSIYPAASPGGWNIIGRCPSVLFNPANDQTLPFEVGDRIQFMPISRQEFVYLGGALDEL